MANRSILVLPSFYTNIKIWKWDLIGLPSKIKAEAMITCIGHVNHKKINYNNAFIATR